MCVYKERCDDATGFLAAGRPASTNHYVVNFIFVVQKVDLCISSANNLSLVPRNFFTYDVCMTCTRHVRVGN